LQNLGKIGRKEAGKYFYNYLKKKPYNSLYLLRIFLRNYQKMCSYIEFSFAYIVQKVAEKLVYTVFSEVSKFSNFSGYFGRKGLKQSGNSVGRRDEHRWSCSFINKIIKNYQKFLSLTGNGAAGLYSKALP
jgi:hypothetical protein